MTPASSRLGLAWVVSGQMSDGRIMNNSGVLILLSVVVYFFSTMVHGLTNGLGVVNFECNGAPSYLVCGGLLLVQWFMDSQMVWE